MELPASVNQIIQSHSAFNQKRMLIDFFLSGLAGWFFWALSLWLNNIIFCLVCFSVAVVLFYRALFFLHEFTHSGIPTWFRYIWNTVIGFPLLSPIETILYTHSRHHKSTSYGTDGDPEYLPETFMNSNRWLLFLLFALVIPILGVLRYIVLLPVCIVSKHQNRYLIKNFSTLTINYYSKKPDLTENLVQSFSQMHQLSFIYYSLVTLAFFVFKIPFSVLISWYFLLTSIALLNQFRVSVVHNYQNIGQSPLTFLSQVQDSVNIKSSWHSMIWAPLHSNYHALHHAPQVPYYLLPTLHNELSLSEEFSKFYLKLEVPLLSQINRRWSAAKIPKL